MEKELGSDVIKATQASLGKYVKRPPLTEKLLKKPPFRFLHDIVTSVLKTNGFFEGLFEEDELISDNVKDRDSKILFLNKVISVIALTTGKNLSVKPSKIVAGQEAEKTNELLQNLAYALDKKFSSDEAVKKYKLKSKTNQSVELNTKEKDPKPVKKTTDAKKLTSRSTEKLISNKKESALVNKNEKTKTIDPKSKRKETGTSKNEPLVKKSQNLKPIVKEASVESIAQPSINDAPIQLQQEQNDVTLQINDSEDIKVTDAVKGTEISVPQESVVAIQSNAESNPLKIDQEVPGTLNTSYTIAENELNSSLSSQDLMDVENDKTDDKAVLDSKETISTDQIIGGSKVVHSKSKEEPDEAAPLKKLRPVLIPKHSSLDTDIKTKELTRNNSHDNAINYTNRQITELVRPPSVRPSSSRPGAPRLREKIENVVPENDNLLLGKVNIISENGQNDEEDDGSVIIVEHHSVDSEIKLEDQQEALQLSLNEHGHLVQQIINSQQGLDQVAGRTEIEWQFGARKAKEASNQEIEQLRYNIQALSRVANPLGKLMDHIQEDVEVMRQELNQWTDVYKEVSKDMIKQKAASEETLVPLQTRVQQLDIEIGEKRDKINDIKILIHKNTTRIDKLLANGQVQ